MNILVANNHLYGPGGTENYTYALIEELVSRKHNVEYFTFKKGSISNLIETRLGVKFMSKGKYDLILANHNTCVNKLYKYGYIVQTCHGIFPKLEQPSKNANVHVAISLEVHNYLRGLGFNSVLILNGINCDRFYPKVPIHDTLTSVLSLCQSNEANLFIKDCCEKLNVKFNCANKFDTTRTLNVEDYINEADLVVGIGRSAYDSFACGRCVISFDNRSYCGPRGDGYLTKDNIDLSLRYNISGRSTNRSFTKEQFINELRKYNASDGSFLRDYAVNNLNIKTKVNKYLSLKK